MSTLSEFQMNVKNRKMFKINVNVTSSAKKAQVYVNFN